MHPVDVIRALGGLCVRTCARLMVFNLWKTVTSAEEAAPQGAVLVPAE